MGNKNGNGGTGWKEAKAIIIDLDGTLVDSADSVIYMYDTVFGNFGLPKPDHNKLRSLFGRTTVEFVNTLAPQLPEDRKLELLEAIRKITAEAVPLIRKAELCDLVPKLAERHKLAVVTNRGEISTNMILERFGIKKYFELVVSSALHRPKPNPEMLVYVLKQFGISPGEAVFIGDRDVDAMAGARAGITTYLVPLEKSVMDGLLK